MKSRPGTSEGSQISPGVYASSMRSGKNGVKGWGQFLYYIQVGLDNVNNANKEVGNGGGALNWSRAVKKRSASVATKTGGLVKIGTVEGDVMMFSSKIGTETVEGITNFAVKDGKLYLNQLHLQGTSAGNVGRQDLWNMAKDLGKQYNVKEVIIQGGKRTTGKYKGTVPSPITIKVD